MAATIAELPAPALAPPASEAPARTAAAGRWEPSPVAMKLVVGEKTVAAGKMQLAKQA